MSKHLYLGNIATMNVDAIVNAAATDLKRCPGICEAIFLAQSNGMGAKALTDLEEMVSRCLTYRFHEYDIPGTILY